VEENNESLLRKILETQEFEESEIFNTQGHSLFHVAASLGHPTILFALIENLSNISPDIVNANLATPMHLASRNNHQQVVEVILIHSFFFK
jgi:ankyrin repeat protein